MTLLEFMDSDNSGTLTQGEFLSGMVAAFDDDMVQQFPDSVWSCAFDAGDTSQDNVLTQEELMALLFNGDDSLFISCLLQVWGRGPRLWISIAKIQIIIANF